MRKEHTIKHELAAIAAEPGEQLPIFRMRTQMDSAEENERHGLEAAIRCPPEEDRTRQADKDSADINKIMERAQRGHMPVLRAVHYGEQDDSLSLLSALNAADNVFDAWASLPEETRKKYPSPEHLMYAAQRGTLTREELGGRPPEPPEPPKGPAATDAPGPSSGKTEQPPVSK